LAQNEQRLPALFGIAGHLDLYVMGASGPGRRQVQILSLAGNGGLILEDASAPWCQEGTAGCEGELIAEGPTGPAYDRWSAVE
jgi:hypothetical protein